MFAVAGSTSNVTNDSSVDSGHRSVQHVSIVATAGSSLSLSCSADNQPTPMWDYYPHTSSQSVTVYNGAKPSKYLDPRFLLDVASCRVNNCILRIEHLQLKDAGLFVCLHSVRKYVSLTVLGQ